MSGYMTMEISEVVFVVIGSGGGGGVNGRKGGIRDCVRLRDGSGIDPTRRLVGGSLNAFQVLVGIVPRGQGRFLL